jgi:hypothetical protein
MMQGKDCERQHYGCNSALLQATPRPQTGGAGIPGAPPEQRQVLPHTLRTHTQKRENQLPLGSHAHPTEQSTTLCIGTKGSIATFSL